MSTTTIRLPDDLKARVSSAAKRAGKTTHSFILEAIAEKTMQDENRAGFAAQAEARYANVIATGETIPWTEMREYLKAKVTGQDATLPNARKLAR